MRHLLPYGLPVALLISLAACGSGSSIPPAAQADPQAAASASSEGFVTYVTGLVASLMDDIEPQDVSKITPKESDDTEAKSL
ncbi:hypothetical protein ACMYR3_01840 [Ampullimonas aquatilis]|uniref:hypothetical protein n=1 Tax=Ampullimonas aquatilis TaxID=1341549 RepID=UPI003C744393